MTQAEAIEVLKKETHRLMTDRIIDIGIHKMVTGEVAPNNLPNTDVILQLTIAIAHLQRKVKKDPRVDGLPHFGRPHFVWDKYGDVHIYDYHSEEKDDMWWYCLNGRKLTTDEILYYADPEEIV